MSTSGGSRTEAQAKRSRKTPAERRAELVEAADLVFLEKGYEAATVADITGRAGSSHGTFYVYFDSKEDIFDAVAQDRVMLAFDAVSECAGQRDRPAVDRIRDVLKMNSEPELTGWWVEDFSQSHMTHLRERLIHKALDMRWKVSLLSCGSCHIRRRHSHLFRAILELLIPSTDECLLSLSGITWRRLK